MGINSSRWFYDSCSTKSKKFISSSIYQCWHQHVKSPQKRIWWQVRISASISKGPLLLIITAKASTPTKIQIMHKRNLDMPDRKLRKTWNFSSLFWIISFGFSALFLSSYKIGFKLHNNPKTLFEINIPIRVIDGVVIFFLTVNKNLRHVSQSWFSNFTFKYLKSELLQKILVRPTVWPLIASSDSGVGFTSACIRTRNLCANGCGVRTGIGVSIILESSAHFCDNNHQLKRKCWLCQSAHMLKRTHKPRNLFIYLSNASLCSS